MSQQYPRYPGQSDVPEPARPIRGPRVALGVGLAILGHVLTIGAGVGLGLASRSVDVFDLAVAILLVGQVVVFLACVIVGIVQLARGDRGVGLGLLVGWAVGVLVLPVVGFGVCVAVFRVAG